MTNLRLTHCLFLMLSLIPRLARGQERLETATPQHGYFTTSDGVKIHYFTLGQDGSWVVLIHGYLASAERMWLSTGIAVALSGNHRVIALDNRNHGKSDAPRPNEPGRAEDVIELMDHLHIERAHIHGYSMGGAMLASLLVTNPERFLSAAFGGSGIFETDAKLRSRADSLDKPVTAPPGIPTETVARMRALGEQSMADASMRIDLRKIAVPVLAINGEFDRPTFKTQRMWRELRDFRNVVLIGKNHLTTLGFLGPAPAEYVSALQSFIDGLKR